MSDSSIAKQTKQLHEGNRGGGERSKDCNRLREPVSLYRKNDPLHSLLERRGAGQGATYTPIAEKRRHSIEELAIRRLVGEDDMVAALKRDEFRARNPGGDVLSLTE